MDLSVIIPTFNEAPNIAELVRRIGLATAGFEREIIFVDDSTDETADTISRVAEDAGLAVRLIQRPQRTGGLGGAVLEGITAASSDTCVVMDGDLQHPPEVIPTMFERYRQGDVDVVIASRYAGGGAAAGLSGWLRHTVSKLTTMLSRAMFPIRLRQVTDPMTGFFLVDRRRLDAEALKPRGFKILLEILTRQSLRTAEVPFEFAHRHAGESKASVRQGVDFILQLTALRFGKMSLFAIIGGLGAIANVAIVWALTHLGVDYLIAAIIAAEATIVANFLLIERFVFQDMKSEASGVWARFAKSVTFNNVELIVRLPLLAVMVSSGHLTAVVATAVTLLLAFIVRYVFHALVVYAPRRTGARASAARRALEVVDEQVMRPGEL